MNIGPRQFPPSSFGPQRPAPQSTQQRPIPFDLNPWDQDEMIGASCGSEQYLSTENPRLNLTWDSGERQQFQVQFPKFHSGIRNLSLDATSRRVAFHTHDYSRQAADLWLVDLPEEPGSLATPLPVRPLLHLEQPINDIEWSHDGKLLVAQGSQVLKLEGQTLQPWLDLGAQVKAIDTLQDGALCLKVGSNSPAGWDQLYRAAGQDSPLEILPLPQPLREFSNPQARASVVARLDPPRSPLWARTPQQEFGEILSPRKLDPWMPFSAGADLNQSSWSPDGRFFSISSNSLTTLGPSIKDSLIWDSQLNQTHLLPGVHRVDFQDNGELRLQFDSPNQVWEGPLDLVSGQPWYLEQQTQPIFLSDEDRCTWINYRGGHRQQIAGAFDKLASTRDHSHLLKLRRSEPTQVWDMKSGFQFEIPWVDGVGWDPENQSLSGRQAGSEHIETLKASEFHSCTWYREALERKAQEAISPVAVSGVVEHQAEATIVNGLRMPKRRPS